MEEMDAVAGRCYDNAGTTAPEMCKIYRHGCKSGETLFHDNRDEDYSQQDLSFIGISFSVNTTSRHTRRAILPVCMLNSLFVKCQAELNLSVASISQKGSFIM
eukprot:4921333-Ditylum_brightwellii.AAC.1